MANFDFCLFHKAMFKLLAEQTLLDVRANKNAPDSTINFADVCQFCRIHTHHWSKQSDAAVTSDEFRAFSSNLMSLPRGR